ncbi:hypothetical protein [Tropicibacter naphthalenivorans]|uniref:Uncharacterized protein n=1 Tax=Tropicibacter naphthalenivorans TaxID=441103 RepID=A0A0P1GDV9_9RHOB|nr:hypothetical protein [Tropicibacter naphthalenivorans]CUH79352.1 hypothetical protein TRN7648_02427 [Tropicibacter naphthalenivorans]SMC71551.1 hypothetical protein SAMN04488093_10357 [Tropicibacter naphthalenivorans]
MIRPWNLSLCFVAASLPMLGAALVVLEMSLGLLAMLALVALIRLAWLDDNIVNDLLESERLPTAYINTMRRRQIWAWRLFGVASDRDPADVSPSLLATRLKAEAQCISTVLLTGAALVGAVLLPGLVGGVFFALMFWAAWQQMDRLAVTLVVLEYGAALPRERLLWRPAWVGSWLPRDDG